MFKTEIRFLPVNNYPDAHHSKGGMKFATQISPLLNLSWIMGQQSHPIKIGDYRHMNYIRI